MRQHYKPMLAQTVDAPFNSKDWIFEVKWDGFRAISYIDSRLSVKSRNNKELKHNFPELEELKSLTSDTVLDGEIVIMRGGRPDFQTLLERSKATSPIDIEYISHKYPATYVVFDILEKDKRPLVDLPIIERKRILKGSLREGRHVVLSLFAEGDGEAYYRASLKKGVEGIVAKRRDSPYEPGSRSNSWLKIKKVRSCDCVIFGYTIGEGNREGTLGALLLGLYDGDRPVYVGKVGTGFTQSDLELLIDTFRRLEVKKKILQGVDVPQEVIWLKPELVCEVAYQTVTKDGKLRMPRFWGLRSDKNPRECTADQLKRHGFRSC